VSCALRSALRTSGRPDFVLSMKKTITKMQAAWAMVSTAASQISSLNTHMQQHNSFIKFISKGR
jgi:hypothetical protein